MVPPPASAAASRSRSPRRAASPGRLALALACALATAPAAVHAQTVRDIANRGACSTAGVEGLSRQLAEAQACFRPGQFVEFAPHRNISLSSSRVFPFLQKSARDALWSAADAGVSLTINSAFRTVADQYVLYHSGACGLAASPGTSNHQSGRAVDVGNYSAVRSALEARGCAWLGSSDPVHFDCPGTDQRAESIRSFQKLWNINHPEDRIDEDGVYGPQTDARLASAPASGFARDGCSCDASCDGSVMVGEDCGRSDCAPFGATCAADALGLRCVSVFCPPTGAAKVCTDETHIADCSDGALAEPGDCGAFGAVCSTAGAAEARCVSAFCVASPSDAPVAHDLCLPDGQLARCDADGGIASEACPDGTVCVEEGGGAACLVDGVVGPGPSTPPGDEDAGSGPADGAGDAGFGAGDAGAAGASLTPRGGKVTGGCAVAAPGAPGHAVPLLLISALAVLRRRRHPRG